MFTTTILIIIFISVAECGYYKVRAPPPPPPPPASIHYGPHPPTHYHGSHHGSHHTSPHSHHHHSLYHHHPPPSRLSYPSRVPYLSHYRPSPPLPAKHWKSPPLPPSPPQQAPLFRPPIIKESFLPPPTPSYTPNFIRDDDKGPIHTIPAPNLSPADKPANFDHQFYKKPDDIALAAVLNHGINNVNVQHTSSYQVTEDLSNQQSHGFPQYFAPDPDPSIPTPKVPLTNDPYSQPSNGQVPLDLYLQQQAEQLQQPPQSIDNTNSLTAQDLFNLLNYQQNTVNLIPQTQLQQHVLQPNIQFYTQPAAMLIPTPQFSPQFHTFNYDEQTQQGPYASNSFPLASINPYSITNGQLRGNLNEVDNLITDNDIAASNDKAEIYEKSDEANEVQTDEKSTHKTISTDEQFSNSYYPTVSNKNVAEVLTSLSAAAVKNLYENNSQEKQREEKSMETIDDHEEDDEEAENEKDKVENDSSEIMEQDENDQVKKTISMYATSFSSSTSQDNGTINNKSNSNINFKTFEPVLEKIIENQNINHVPFGVRIRPKRF